MRLPIVLALIIVEGRGQIFAIECRRLIVARHGKCAENVELQIDVFIHHPIKLNPLADFFIHRLQPIAADDNPFAILLELRHECIEFLLLWAGEFFEFVHH